MIIIVKINYCYIKSSKPRSRSARFIMHLVNININSQVKDVEDFLLDGSRSMSIQLDVVAIVQSRVISPLDRCPAAMSLTESVYFCNFFVVYEQRKMLSLYHV